MFEACVIGCGQIGTEVMKALTQQRFNKDEIIGTDISTAAIERMEAEGFRMTNTMAMPEAKVYFICVWDTLAVIDILKKLDEKIYIDCIFIDTTLDPSLFEKVDGLISMGSWDLQNKVVIFPHRFNPNDPEHHIFNLKRLFAPYNEAADQAAREFLIPIMNSHLLEWTTPQLAVLSKVVENAYRAMEIILAQEIKKACLDKNIDFNHLLEAVNSKWNVNIKEARDGVKGKCLPKDLALFNKFFPTNALSKIMEVLNNDYVTRHSKT